MRLKPAPNYLAGYPTALTEQVQRLIDENRLADVLLKKYPLAHAVQPVQAARIAAATAAPLPARGPPHSF